jgi:hypothetical protein
MAQNDAVRPEEKIHFVSAEFDQIKAKELQHLGPEVKADNLIGLALSGGGVRSASFALGVLQALYGFGVFDRFHYLSTVSGGGYIGSALTYFRNVFRDFGEKWFPFGYLRPQAGARGTRPEGAGQTEAKPDDVPPEVVKGDAMARKIVSFLRQHASFLTPSRQLNTAALGAGVVRGLISTVIPYLVLLTGALGLLMSWHLFDKNPGWISLPAIAMPDYEGTPPLPPAAYLAKAPAYLGLGLIGLILAIYFFSSVIAGLNNVLDRKEKNAKSGYLQLIRLYSLSGAALLLAAAILVVATLPWVHEYLHFLSEQVDSRLPTDFAALVAALGGALGLVGRLRGILGGKASEPSLLRAVGMSVAGVLFVYGVFLLAFGAADHILDPAGGWHSSLICLLIGAITAFVININLANQHRIYRDRLMEVFCADEEALKLCRWRPALRSQAQDGWLVSMKKAKTPYHMINTCIATTDSDDRRFRGRGGDNFILAPLYCGSDATGWVATDEALPTLTIATAAAVSGAALNAHTGPHGSGLLRNKAYSALLSFLGLNLGFWSPNPKRFAGRKKGHGPFFYMPNLLKPGLSGLTGRSIDEEGAYVQLSDGAHFENLAIYELVRRKVKFLWVSDAGQDDGFTFEDLSIAVERVRVDFGVHVRFRDSVYDLTHLIPGSIASDKPSDQNFFKRYDLATRGYAIGTIEYPDAPDGIIVYVKSTLTTGLPGDLYGYKARNDAFPHQTTLDQFFDEEQFEAYRELGYRLSAKLFRDIEDSLKPGGPTLSPTVASVAKELGFKPRPTG